MDRDTPYFQDFRANMEASLNEGCSITIVPEEESSEIHQVRWNG